MILRPNTWGDMEEICDSTRINNLFISLGLVYGYIIFGLYFSATLLGALLSCTTMRAAGYLQG